jgi:transposase
MYAALSGPKGKESVQIREDYIPVGEKKHKIRIVKQLGPLKKLQADNPNYFEELKAYLKLETARLKEGKTVQVTLSMDNVRKPEDGYRMIRFGHSIVKNVWDTMGLDGFFRTHCGKRNADAVLEGLFYLVTRRLSNPSSVLSSFQSQAEYAGVRGTTLDVLYSVLKELDNEKDALVDHLCSFFEKKTKRDKGHVCYDVTNYYFESTDAGELRLFGFSKEHKNNEVLVVMGLLIDSNGIPISFQLFPGNMSDQETLCDSVKDLKKRYGFREITVVADRGMNSNDNLVYLSGEGHHFVISYTLKKAKAEFREMCIGASPEWGKMEFGADGELSYASKVLDTTCGAKVEMSESERAKEKEERKKARKKGPCPKYRTEEIPAKVHVTYSRKRAEKDRSDRLRALEKLTKRIENGQIASSMRYGCNQYLDVDIDGKNAKIDLRKIEDAARFDGFYAVVTDRKELTTDEVMDIYRDQWKIEESFRILKTDLEARPVFVWSDESIRGHFTLCYLCLSIIRYLQYFVQDKTGEAFSAERIMDAIAEPAATVLGEKDKPYFGVFVNADYLAITKALGMPPLQKTMSAVRFRALTKLDPTRNVAGLVVEKQIQ